MCQIVLLFYFFLYTPRFFDTSCDADWGNLILASGERVFLVI